jgi:hypothetical protein
MFAHPNAARLASSVALVVLLLGTAAAHAESTRAWSFKPDKGFIGDPMAFDAGETQFAYIHTDSAKFLNIIVRATSGFKKTAEIKIDNPAAIPKQLAFTQNGKRLVFVWMDGHKGTRSATLFDIAAQKAVKKIGPADHVALIPHKGQQVVTLTTTKTDKKGGNNFTVSAHRTTDFRKVARGTTYVQADLRLRKPKVRLLYWEPGHASLVGMQKGKYDRKRDIRLPERGTRYNVLLRKVTWSEETKEVVAWTKATTMRPNNKGQLRFLQVADDLKTIHYVDRDNTLGTVKTPLKWRHYEPKSLVQVESWDGKDLHFSVTIDPVNPDAVKRKKADKERCDLYRLDPGPRVTPLGRVLTRKRTFTWAAGKRFFSYLYKLRGFGRGGKEVAIFKVGTK